MAGLPSWLAGKERRVSRRTHRRSSIPPALGVVVSLDQMRHDDFRARQALSSSAQRPYIVALPYHQSVTMAVFLSFGGHITGSHLLASWRWR